MESHSFAPNRSHRDLTGGHGQPASDISERLKELYDRYASRVYSFVLYRVGDHDDTADITAEIFERAITSYEGYDPDRGRPAAWLFGIAHRTVSRHWRRSLRRRLVPDGNDIIARRATRLPGPEDQIVSSVDRTQLQRAMGRLKDRDRSLLSLRYQGDLDNEEIAEILHMRKQSVAVALHRALRRLREEIEKEDYYDNRK